MFPSTISGRGWSASQVGSLRKSSNLKVKSRVIWPNEWLYPVDATYYPLYIHYSWFCRGSSRIPMGGIPCGAGENMWKLQCCRKTSQCVMVSIRNSGGGLFPIFACLSPHSWWRSSVWVCLMNPQFGLPKTPIFFDVRCSQNVGCRWSPTIKIIEWGWVTLHYIAGSSFSVDGVASPHVAGEKPQMIGQFTMTWFTYSTIVFMVNSPAFVEIIQWQANPFPWFAMVKTRSMGSCHPS